MDQLERPEEGRLVAGVCAAFARRFSMDVTLIRLAFLLLALASGVGLLLYLLFWILMPAREAGKQPVKGIIWTNLRGMQGELFRAARRLSKVWSRAGENPWPRPLGRRWVALALIAVGLFVFLYSLGLFAWLGAVRALGLAAVVVGVGVLVTLAPEWRQ